MAPKKRRQQHQLTPQTWDSQLHWEDYESSGSEEAHEFEGQDSENEWEPYGDSGTPADAQEELLAFLLEKNRLGK